MDQILFVNSCVRPNSRTYSLAESVLARLNGDVQTVRLDEAHIPALDGVGVQKRDELLRQGKLDDPMLAYARQFARADTIVIAAPYWDLMFPALLKAYLEAVTVCGLTFRYTQQGIPASLCAAKRLIYVTTAGGPIGDFDFGFRYVEALARGFFGIEDILCVKAEGLDIVGADVPAILEAAQTEAARLLEKI